MNLSSKNIAKLISPNYYTVQFLDAHGKAVFTVRQPVESLNLNNNSIHSLLDLLPLATLDLVSVSLARNPVSQDPHLVPVLGYLLPTLKYYNGESLPRRHNPHLQQVERNYLHMLSLQLLLAKLRLCRQVAPLSSPSLDLLKRCQPPVHLTRHDRVNLVHDVVLFAQQSANFAQALTRFHSE